MEYLWWLTHDFVAGEKLDCLQDAELALLVGHGDDSAPSRCARTLCLGVRATSDGCDGDNGDEGGVAYHDCGL